jgi:hypothetical protein
LANQFETLVEHIYDILYVYIHTNLIPIKEFLNECESLYAEMSKYSADLLPNKEICELLLNQLKTSLECVRSSRPDQLSIVLLIFAFEMKAIQQVLSIKTC